MFRRVLTSLFIAALTIAIGGSAAVRSNLNPGDHGGKHQLPRSMAEGTLDEFFASVAEQVPAFGGLFYDESGQLTMYVAEGEPKVRAAVRSAMAAAFGRSERIPNVDAIRVLPGQYGFLQLKEWSDRMSGEVLALPGVILTDIDEARNRLKIGVENLEMAGQVEEVLANLGIAREAVIIEETEPIIPLATLQDKVRPLQAGLQINFPGYLCTLGFNAIRAGVSGFVTCSHCTNTQGGVERTPYWQPLQSVDPVQIGTETVDPVYTRSKCPGTIRGKVCRWSDSAFAALASGVSASRGFIEQTTGVNTGSLTIAGSFQIVGEASSSALRGETLNKVGRTTGWSQGLVTSTCVNTGVSGSNIVQLCQDFVDATVGAGDSGSPVFKISSGSNVTLYGILWGGNNSGTNFVYSPMKNVQRSDELGPLNTCASGSC